MTALRLLQVPPDELHHHAAALARMEASIRYPLGQDRFRLDHGVDPFAFFRRLGEPHHRLAYDGNHVVGAACAVLRAVPDGRGGRMPAWYICDVKVLPSHQTTGLALRLVMLGFREAHQQCPRAYAVSMNPPRGANPVTRLMRRWFQRGSVAGSLDLFSLSHDDMVDTLPVLQKAWGPVGFLSLAGIKDVVLESTGAPMPLWHVQHGAMASPRALNAPQPGGTHMFCVTQGTALHASLRSLGRTPLGSATVLQYGMDGWDFAGAILTSDI
jgi:hypothetical protein